MNMNGGKHTVIPGLFVVLCFIAFGLAEWVFDEDADVGLDVNIMADQPVIHEPIQPLPAPPMLDVDKVALGEKLFNEPRLSVDDSISCAHCHDLASGGSDGLRHAMGVNGKEGLVNSPTVFNAALHIAQFWDGRAPTLEAQIDGPVHNPKEMASSWPEVIAKLGADSGYTEAFSKLYPDGISSDTIKDAIATFERTLVTLNAPFDRFLRGDADAISVEAKQGYRLFKEYGCASCHQGANVGGNMYQRFGVVRDYFADHAIENQADMGRFNVTGREEDRHFFRVPCLRLVTLTAPYFHNGSAETLEDAIKVMAKYQLGREISRHDISLIIAFLGTLAGEYRGNRLQP